MTMDIKIAWRNVWRNPRRTWLTVAAIGFACVILIFMLSFQFGSYATMINSAIQINTGHIQIQNQKYFDEKSIHEVIAKPGPVLEMADQIRSVVAVSARARAFGLVSSDKRTMGVMITGIDPENEARVSSLKSLMRKGKFLTSADPKTNPAIVGKMLARNLGAGPGDELIILGQARDGSVAAAALTLCGIYESGMDEFDRNTLHIRLDQFQEIYFMKEAVHEIVIRVQDLGTVVRIKQELADGLKQMPHADELAVFDWDDLMPGLTQAIKLDLTIGIIFWFLLVLVVAFSILNTFLMAVLERTREFGVMMAMGTTPARLVKLILFESGAMTLVGVASGIVLGCLVTWIFQIYGIDFSGASEILEQYGISGRIYPKLSFITAFAGPSLVWIITFAVSLYPALKIRNLRPVKAIAGT